MKLNITSLMVHNLHSTPLENISGVQEPAAGVELNRANAKF